MATHKVKTVAVELDRTRHLRMDMNALCLAEELTGRNLLLSSAREGLSVRDIRAVVYACLVHEDSDLTLDSLGAQIHPGNLADIIEKLRAVFADSVDAADAEEGTEDESPLGVSQAAEVKTAA